MKKNYLRIGLKSRKKIEKSFYQFLYEKHFDWAIILASFFGVLPYIGSKTYLIFTLKIILFSLIMYFCISYILTWKQLQDYYKKYQEAIKASKKLASKIDINKIENEKIAKFFTDLRDSIKRLIEAYKQSLDKNISFEEFLKENKEIAEPLLSIFNKDKKIDSTLIGNSIGVLIIISHIRGIPKFELENYYRLLLLILLLVIFFAIHTIEILFIQ